MPARVHGDAGGRLARRVSGWPGMPPSTLIENVAPGAGAGGSVMIVPALPPEPITNANEFDWNP